MTVNPIWVESSSIGGTFQSNEGSGASGTITITFSAAVRSVTVTIYDPTWVGNSAGAYNETGALVGSVSFAYSGSPGVNTPNSRTLAYSGIRKVELIPAPNEYVAYDVTFQLDSCPPTGDPDSILDSPAVRKGLEDALRNSNPNATPGTGVKKERGGVIWFDTTSKSLYTQEIVDPNATECTYNNPGGMITPPIPGSIGRGYFHTHPSGKLEKTYGCPGWSQTPADGLPPAPANPDDPKAGGGSPGDWNSVSAPGSFPNYVISKTGTLYKLTPEFAPPAKRKTNPHKWELKSNPGCPTRIP